MRTLGIIVLVAGFGALAVQGQLAGTGFELLPYILMGIAAILIVLSIGRPASDSVDFETTPVQSRPQVLTQADPAQIQVSAGSVRVDVSGISPEQVKRITELLKQKKVIEAVKEVRLATGLGLKESKDLVDRLRSSLK